jgi:hypothetical protein
MNPKEMAYVDHYRVLYAKRDRINALIGCLRQLNLAENDTELNALLGECSAAAMHLERMWADLASDERVGLPVPGTLVAKTT